MAEKCLSRVSTAPPAFIAQTAMTASVSGILKPFRSVCQSRFSAASQMWLGVGM